LDKELVKYTFMISDQRKKRFLDASRDDLLALVSDLVNTEAVSSERVSGFLDKIMETTADRLNAASKVELSPEQPEFHNAASIFNDFILSNVVFALNKLGILSLFKNGVTFEEIVRFNNFEEKRLKELLKIAQVMGLLEERGMLFHLTKLGADVERNIGFFTWAIGGYSSLIEGMDIFVVAPACASQSYVRGEYVAVGSDEVNQRLMQHIFDEVIDQISFDCVADLGCGNAGRLVNLLKRKPGLTGVGIDINPQAVEVAQNNIDRSGFSDKMDVVCENVFTSLSEHRSEFDRVELVMSFMMLHDLFNIEELHGKLFAKVKESFPRAKYFVFADTCLDEESRTSFTMPVFTMGYELVHIMRGIRLFPLQYYKEQFEKEGLELVAQHDFGVANTYLFVLKVE
jgi:hypothetical protein